MIDVVVINLSRDPGGGGVAGLSSGAQVQAELGKIRSCGGEGGTPPGLDQLGLVKTLYLYCEDFSKSTTAEIDFAAAGVDELNLEYETEINIYRLIQEALNNIKRHAGANRVTIRVVASSPDIVIRIKDNGKGFDVNDRRKWALKEKRMGLQSMVERVRLLQGKINIQSRPNKGTYIFIAIPLKENTSVFQEEHSDY